jgi:hypothetical protein
MATGTVIPSLLGPIFNEIQRSLVLSVRHPESGCSNDANSSGNLSMRLTDPHFSFCPKKMAPFGSVAVTS